MTYDLITIDFEPVGKRVRVLPGSTILEAARQAGIELSAICGGRGTCKKCQVQVLIDEVEEPDRVTTSQFSKDLLERGWRLACRTKVWHATKVYLPPDSLSTQQRLQLEGIEVDPEKVSIGGDKHIHEAKAGYGYGLAVDLGTTKIAAYLVELRSGKTIGRASAMNPQIHYGEDVISRIQYCVDEPGGRTLLQSKVVESVNLIFHQLCRESGVKPDQVDQAVVVGNTVMQHLFAGLPVEQLGHSPFEPAVTSSLCLPAAEIGLKLANHASIYLPENIAGYVGGDHVAMMVATQAHRATDTTIALDIGTNTEISLVHEGRIFTCSCASGPAFEGAHILYGMRAAQGAIERVKIEGDEIFIQTIDHQPAIGICGSGILDGIAELYKNSIINERGNFVASHKMIKGAGKNAKFILVPESRSGCDHEITIARKDINEILLAKAAIQTGIEVLLKCAEITTNQIERFIVAGAFGTYLSIESAIQIGMFPELPIDRFYQVGNAAGSGARLMLLSEGARDQATRFAQETNYIELTLYPDFQRIYIDSLKFPGRKS